MKGHKSIPRFTPPVLVGDIPAEQEEEYLKWAAKNGIWHAEAMKYPSYTPAGIRGVVATDNIYAGEDLIRVPENLMVCRKTIVQNPVLKKAIDTFPGIFDVDEDANLALWVTYHRCVLKERSPFWEYVRILPDLDLLSDWSEEELVELGDDDRMESALNRCAKFNSIASMIVEVLNEKLPEEFPSDRFTVPWFIWAYKQVSARGFGSKLTFVTMVPLADCFNHSNVLSMYSVDSCSKSSIAAAEHPIPAADLNSSQSGVSVSSIGSDFEVHTNDTASDECPHTADNFFRIKVFPRYSSLETAASTSFLPSLPEDCSKKQSLPMESYSHPGSPVSAREVVFKTGEEITICYGTKDNFNLLLDYGFPLDYNPNETYPLPLPRWRTVYPAGMAPTCQSLRVQELAGSAQLPLPLKYNHWADWSLLSLRQWAFGQTDDGEQLMQAWKTGKIKSFRKPFPSEVCNPLDVERNALVLFMRFLTALAREDKGEYVLSALKRRIHWKNASLSLEKSTVDHDNADGNTSDSSQGSLVVYLDRNVYSVAPRRVLERRRQNKERKEKSEPTELMDLFGFADVVAKDLCETNKIPAIQEQSNTKVFLPYEDNVPLRFLLCMLYRATRYNIVLTHIAYASSAIALFEYFQLLKRDGQYDASKSIFWQIFATHSMRKLLLEPLLQNSESRMLLQHNRDLFYKCKSIVEIARTTTPAPELGNTATLTASSSPLHYHYPLPIEADFVSPMPPGTECHSTMVAASVGYLSVLYLLFGSDYLSALHQSPSVESASTPKAPHMDEDKFNTMSAVITNYAETGSFPTALMEFVTSAVRSVPELKW